MIQRCSTNATHVFERFAERCTCWAGGPYAFFFAIAIVVIWLVSGPIFGYSDTWQLVINTGTTIITFLMVFLIQHAQNKDSHAIQLKLNEVIAALEGASNRLINAEDMSDEDIQVLHQHYDKLAKIVARDQTATASHSIEEAEHRDHGSVKTTAKTHKAKTSD